MDSLETTKGASPMTGSRPKEIKKPKIEVVYAEVDPDLVRIAKAHTPKGYANTKTNLVIIGLSLIAIMPEKELLEYLKRVPK